MPFAGTTPSSSPRRSTCARPGARSRSSRSTRASTEPRGGSGYPRQACEGEADRDPWAVHGDRWRAAARHRALRRRNQRSDRHGGVARRSGVNREYPSEPRVGVGAVVLDGDRVLLVKRGRPPALHKWSLPGGLVHLGETTRDAVVREIAEECGLTITVAGVAGVADRVTRDADGRVKYHYVLVDYLAYPQSTRLTSGSDAAEARWVEIDRVAELDTTDGLVDMIRRAQTLRGGARA